MTKSDESISPNIHAPIKAKGIAVEPNFNSKFQLTYRKTSKTLKKELKK